MTLSQRLFNNCIIQAAVPVLLRLKTGSMTQNQFESKCRLKCIECLQTYARTRDFILYLVALFSARVDLCNAAHVSSDGMHMLASGNTASYPKLSSSLPTTASLFASVHKVQGLL